MTEVPQVSHWSHRRECPDRIPLTPSAGGWWGRCEICGAQYAFGAGWLKDADGYMWDLEDEEAVRREKP